MVLVDRDMDLGMLLVWMDLVFGNILVGRVLNLWKVWLRESFELEGVDFSCKASWWVKEGLKDGCGYREGFG